MKKIKYIGIFTIIWLAIFMGESIYELFQIEKSSTITTFLGLRIVTTMTKEELYNQFSLTSKAVFIYIVFIIVCSLFFSLLRIYKRKKV